MVKNRYLYIYLNIGNIDVLIIDVKFMIIMDFVILINYVNRLYIIWVFVMDLFYRIILYFWILVF